MIHLVTVATKNTRCTWLFSALLFLTACSLSKPNHLYDVPVHAYADSTVVTFRQTTYNSWGEKPLISGQVKGRHSDTVLQHALVTLINLQTNERIATGTDSTGKYTIECNAGVYRFAIEYVGYFTFREDSMEIMPGKTYRLDVALGEFGPIVGSRKVKSKKPLEEKDLFRLRWQSSVRQKDKKN